MKGNQSEPPKRGSLEHLPNRFATTHRAADPDVCDLDPAEEPLPRTQFIPDDSQSLISENQSPDVGFTHSINPYRGCEHGCAYCYARPYHEYLGFDAGLDFESKIVFKPAAAAILRRELSSPRWKPTGLALSGVTDCYQPVERRLRITRACLEVLAEFRHPAGIVTKNTLVVRDADLLGELARFNASRVWISLTTLDPDLRAIMEPRTSPIAARLKAITALRSAGVPVGVLFAPVIPAINDAEAPAVLAAAAAAGAQYAGKVVLRLPLAVAPVFEAWLDRHFPARKEKVLAQLREYRGGRKNDARFGSRMTGEGPSADRLSQWFDVARRRAGLGDDPPPLSTAAFRVTQPGQAELW
jgi:DNA repair photolyase